MSDSENLIDASRFAAEKERKFRLQAAAFLSLVSGISALFGFSYTLGKAKQTEGKELLTKRARQNLILMDEGSALAMRALGWGTLYAVLGVGTFTYGLWKLSGAKDFEGFRLKIGNALPRISRDEPTSNCTDLESLTDLMKYQAAWAKE